MAYYADLSVCDFGGSVSGRLVAVGWLDPSQPFSRGRVPKEFFLGLVQLLVDPWQPVVTAGRQRCPFCRFSGGPADLTYESTTVRVGSANLFVPTNEAVFVSPSLIVHYIDAHEYAPPLEFQEAVHRCPGMRTAAYLRSVREHGLHKLGQGS